MSDSTNTVSVIENNFFKDERVLWIRQRVLIALNILPDTFDDFFKDSLQRARSSGISREQLSSFLSSQSNSGSSMFFSSYLTTEDVEIEEEIEVDVEPEEMFIHFLFILIITLTLTI